MNLKCLYVITQVPKPLVALVHIIELSSLNSVIAMEIGLLLMSYHWPISVQLLKNLTIFIELSVSVIHGQTTLPLST